MKLLFTTLNSKYIHSCLAIKYLSKCVRAAQVNMREYTINEDIEGIYQDILTGGYDLVAFSCYIWNIERTLKIAENLKKVRPELTIVLGGPEVSYEVEAFLQKNPWVDLIVVGEGELAWQKLDAEIARFEAQKTFGSFASYLAEGLRTQRLLIANLFVQEHGICHYVRSETQRAAAMVIEDLSIVPRAYEGVVREDIENKIVYYETSRGCNYNCAYCLSAAQKGIRYFEESRVFEELQELVLLGAKQIKLVDRTFNSAPERTMRLLEYIMRIDNGTINFHFEITAHLLTQEQTRLLGGAREGLFQLEIGVQSTHTKTLAAVHRGNHFEPLSVRVREIQEAGNIHQHLDLIAGLPYETLERFKRSFDDVFALRPQMLQLGFLKMLKGSPMYDMAEQYGYVVRSYPPYEILANRFLSAEDLTELKQVEQALDRYYNTQRYRYSMRYLTDYFGSGYALFRALAKIIEGERIALNQKNEEFRAVYLLSEQIRKDGQTSFAYRHDFLVELLRMDYLMMGRNPNLPDFLKAEHVCAKEDVFQMLSEDGVRAALGFAPELAPKEAIKKINWACFDYDVIVYYNTKEIVQRSNVALIHYDTNRSELRGFPCITREVAHVD